MAEVKVWACFGGSWEVNGELMEYRPFGLMRRALELRMSSTYSDLRRLVANKFDISREAASYLSYQFPFSSSYQVKPMVVEIADDEDVDVFMDIAKKAENASHGLITLYVHKGKEVNDD